MDEKNDGKFKKGNNFGSRRQLVPFDLKATRQYNKFEVERLISHVSFLTYPELKQLAAKSNNGSPAIEMMIAKILLKAVDTGDTWRAAFILDRLVGRVPNPPPEEPIDVTPPKPIENKKKTFSEFCVDAGYPPPFEKQLEMSDFIIREIQIRIFLGARNYGKTEYGTLLSVAYAVYENYWEHYFGDLRPLDETNLIIAKTQTRVNAIIGEIVNALERNGVEMDKSNETTVRVKGLVGPNHSVEGVPLKASFRGRHPKRLIMDDPVTEEDVSEATRALVKRKYNEAYKLCKNICIIGQPAHAFDLYAELRDILLKLEYPWGTIPELDADLEAMKLAGIDQNSIEMSYHLRVPVDSAVPFGKIKYVDQFPAKDSVAFIDPSDGGDYTALSIGTAYFDGIAIEGYAWQRAWYLSLDEIIPILKARNVRKICFETNATGTQPLIQLREALSPLGIGVQGVHSDTNKEAVIMSAGSYSQYIHLSRGSMPIYTKQVTQYEPKAKYDDSPDSLARLLVWLGLIRAKK